MTQGTDVQINATKLRINGEEYPVPTKLTFGELRLLKTQFGVDDLSKLGGTADPAVIAGMAYVCMRRKRPGLPIEEFDKMECDIEPVGEVEDGSDRPPVAAAEGEAAGE